MLNIDILIAICGGAIFGYLLRYIFSRKLLIETFMNGVAKGVEVGYKIKEEEEESDKTEEAPLDEQNSDSTK